MLAALARLAVAAGRAFDAHVDTGHPGLRALRGLTLVLDPAERRSWLLPGA